MKINLISLLWFVSMAYLSTCKTASKDGSDLKFYGTDNQSAIMTFDADLDFELPRGVKSQVDLSKPDVKSQILELIDLQVRHLYGTFSVHDEFRNNPGIVEGKGETLLRSSSVDPGKGRGRIRYTHKDRVVFKKSVFRGDKPTIKFQLPRDPVAIYSRGLDPDGRFNLCTDEHYNSEGDFWYFWHPTKRGCPIGSGDLQLVTGNLAPIPNTKKTYPDYDKLLGDNGNGKAVKIMYLVGVDENFKAGDLGSNSYREAFDLLRQNNFKVKSSIRRRSSLTYSTPDYDVEVDMRLVNPGTDQFVKAAAEGLETADIFIYDGHSGLGGYLYVDRFQQVLGRPLNLNKEKSQIFYFNGCSTFAYYNLDYFKLKSSSADPKGIKFLDVITTSIGATFDIGARHDAVVITNLVNGSRPSWQTIMDQVYKADRRQTALTHVNGDEDNPSTPGLGR